jgi:hypothetical protein
LRGPKKAEMKHNMKPTSYRLSLKFLSTLASLSILSFRVNDAETTMLPCIRAEYSVTSDKSLNLNLPATK